MVFKSSNFLLTILLLDFTIISIYSLPKLFDRESIYKFGILSSWIDETFACAIHIVWILLSLASGCVNSSSASSSFTSSFAIWRNREMVHLYERAKRNATQPLACDDKTRVAWSVQAKILSIWEGSITTDNLYLNLLRCPEIKQPENYNKQNL